MVRLDLESDTYALLDPINDLIVGLKSRIDDLEDEVAALEREIDNLENRLDDQ